MSSVPLIGLSLRDCAVVESAEMALSELNRAIADDFTPLLLFPDHDAAPLDASALELSTHKDTFFSYSNPLFPIHGDPISPICQKLNSFLGHPALARALCGSRGER